MTSINITDGLSLYRGDNKSYSLAFTDSDGNAIDITDWTVFFTAKKFSNLSSDDTSAVIQKDVASHTKPVDGETVIELTSDDTDIEPYTYHFDIQVKKDNNDILTVLVGKLTVNQDVTKRTST